MRAGCPGCRPVWFAPAGYRQFLWVSHPEARHSRNLAVRPTVSIVIFNSQVPEGSAQAVYMAAEAEELTGDALDRGHRRPLRPLPGPGDGRVGGGG